MACCITKQGTLLHSVVHGETQGQLYLVPLLCCYKHKAKTGHLLIKLCGQKKKKKKI